jgi:hypothetical protein
MTAALLEAGIHGKDGYFLIIDWLNEAMMPFNA